LGLSIPELSRALSSAPPGPSPNAALYSAHQWQGRALHPDAAARMGLSASVLHGRRSHARAARLAGALQLRSTTRGAGPAATHESVPGRQQPTARAHLGQFRLILRPYVVLDGGRWGSGEQRNSVGLSPRSYLPCSSAISANRHRALINRICSIVRARDSSSRGLATMQARHMARETATLRRLREKRKSRVRGTSSALEVAIE